MFKLLVCAVLVTSTYACCGLSFTTCCQGSAYAPPRIIGYERIPLYAKVPVQQVPLPPPPAYPIAPQIPTYVTPQTYVSEPPVVMSNYASPVSQPVAQSVMVQEVPAYVAATPTVVVQEVPSARISYAPFALSQGNYGAGIMSNNVPAGLDTNVVNAIDYNNAIRLPTAKALKLRRSYLKQVKN